MSSSSGTSFTGVLAKVTATGAELKIRWDAAGSSAESASVHMTLPTGKLVLQRIAAGTYPACDFKKAKSASQISSHIGAVQRGCFRRPYGKLGQWDDEVEGLLRTWLLDDRTKPLAICDSAESKKPRAICDSAKADETSSDESSSDESSSQSDETAVVGSDSRASWSKEQWMAHCIDLDNSLASTQQAFDHEDEENAKLRRSVAELSAENDLLQQRIKRKKQY